MARKSKAATRPVRDPLPEQFNSLEAAVEFWDTHDSGDYDDCFKDVNVEVELKSHRVATDKFVNRWLEEKAS